MKRSRESEESCPETRDVGFSTNKSRKVHDRYEETEKKKESRIAQCLGTERLEMIIAIQARLLDRRCACMCDHPAAPTSLWPSPSLGECIPRIREFVDKLLAREPMATFARMCLVEGDPVAPGPEAMRHLGRLSNADFQTLWDDVYSVLPLLPLQTDVHDASVELHCMFLRGAGLMREVRPRQWRGQLDLFMYGFLSLLSCNDMMRLLVPADMNEEPGHLGWIARKALYVHNDVNEWLLPENAEGAGILASLVELTWGDDIMRALFPPDVDPSTSGETMLTAWLYDTFTILVPGSSVFAKAVAAVAPIELLRQGLGPHFERAAVDEICSCLKRAATAAHDAYAHELNSAAFFSAAPDKMASMIAQYCTGI